MYRLAIVYELQREAECPVCRCLLIGKAINFVGCIAYCHTCAREESEVVHNEIAKFVYDGFGSQSWSVSQGQIFFTPKPDFPHGIAYHLLGRMCADSLHALHRLSHVDKLAVREGYSL